ncbi:hypothetical protein AB1Y20_010346 [Prymnesium parvum]|uniref:Vps72/YL1 C-terminal domain-containing protein n=1 Tax=Prymnesium parvum TaxID=97485 RepID=A0AB34K463_PRYPA
MVEGKRGGRARKATEKVRVFDASTRAELRKRKLDALEADNWEEEKPTEEDGEYLEEEEDEIVAVGAAKRARKKKAKRDVWNATQKCKSLQEILDEEQYLRYPSWVPNFLSIAAAPSRYPPRRFCSVSGLEAKYKCPVTGEYLATLDAFETHRETRLKGLV